MLRRLDLSCWVLPAEQLDQVCQSEKRRPGGHSQLYRNPIYILHRQKGKVLSPEEPWCARVYRAVNLPGAAGVTSTDCPDHPAREEPCLATATQPTTTLRQGKERRRGLPDAGR